ncbi:hypothetical protein FQR65_LT00730 [Abscondita terminalis]|nr:hypothetical protein FQR65_LT00730 [Abscondita terminalis]
MSSNTYLRTASKVNSIWETTAARKMRDAAKKEADYAIQTGNVDENGIPLLTVVADGCWSKRSYKSNYSALSGVAAIVGNHFGEVLYFGVKNKYCKVCIRPDNLKSKTHVCFKNYTGPSTGMEAAILVEGFKESEKMYGVKYAKLIADGDSSTYKKILESRPYNNISVEKIVCRNHILRNYCNKLKTLSQDTRFPLQLRKLISCNILRLRSSIIGAIKYRKNQENIELVDRINSLKEDIQNSIYHVFGEHEKCNEYFCHRKNDKISNIPSLKSCEELFFRLQQHLKMVWLNARSLIEDVDSNVVEHFNSVVAKHIGGKRINFSLRGSYQARCAAAVVRFNTKTPLTEFYHTLCGTSPSKRLQKFELQRQRKIEQDLLRVKNKTVVRRQRAKSQKQDSEYGESCQKPDLPEDVLAEEMQKFLETLKKTDEERNLLQKSTVLQAGCGKWLEERRKLLTASSFYRVCRRRPTTLSKNLVKDLLYNTKSLNIFSLKHGRDNENIAKHQLEAQENLKILPCRLFIHKESYFLGASPDGLVDNNLIIEIKCPSSAYNVCPDKAIQNGKIKFWKYNIENDCFQINMNDPWYFQIQGQLFVTGRKGCIFAVWTGLNFPLKVAYINKRSDF